MKIEFAKESSTVGFFAKRNSGKSLLIRWLIQHHKSQWKTIFVVSGSESVNKFYSTFIDSNKIFHKYDERWATSLMDKMAKINEGKNKDSPDFTRILLILDDIACDVNCHTSKSLEQLWAKARHYGIGVWISLQYPYMIPPIMRSNMDYLCIGQLNSKSIKIVTEEFAHGKIETKQFLEMLYRCTSDFKFLIIKNTSAKSSDLNEIYGCLKTPENFIKL